MVWLCPLCGHGNFSKSNACIHCNIKRSEIPIEKYDCWSFIICESKKRLNCKVFNEKLGKKCYKIKDKHNGNSDRDSSNCQNCEWYKKIIGIELNQ